MTQEVFKDAFEDVKIGEVFRGAYDHPNIWYVKIEAFSVNTEVYNARMIKPGMDVFEYFHSAEYVVRSNDNQS